MSDRGHAHHGIALSSCIPPAKAAPLFEIGENEMEVGVGIHGEPGRRRTQRTSANEIVTLLLDAVVPDLPYKQGDRVALMINGLGGHAHQRALSALRHRP
jgi:phosphoenolpyruvate---glycerone phosphotransferase subunit DhaK